MKLSTTKIIVTNAVISALYVVLSLPFGAISVSPLIQFRPAEALTVLPALMPSSVIGLTIGCAISNVISTFGLFDVILGATVTLLAGLLTATICNKYYTAPIPPIVLNAFLLPIIWVIAGSGALVSYWLQVISLIISQSVVCYALGLPLFFITKKRILPMLQQ